MKAQFKILIISLSLLCASFSYSQKTTSNKNTFIRLYNIEGKKIAKGKIVSLNDSIIQLKKNSKNTEVYIKEIGKIKTKRSKGHKVGMGGVIGASLGVVLGATYSKPGMITGDSKGERIMTGVLLGAFGGTVLGLISAGTKNSKTFVINGNKENWNIFLDSFKEHL